MKNNEVIQDIDGNEVHVGDFVEVLEIDRAIDHKLPEEERAQVFSMVGEILEVEEIDEFGCAWVTKWFPTKDQTHFSHGIALEKHQMRLSKNDGS
jgi:hypothetical protein